MKHIIYFIIFAIIFIVIGFWPQLTSPGQFHFSYVQQGYEKYESKFDPHKTFIEWPLLHSELHSTTFLVMVGNPKITWTEDNREKEQPIPIGELSSQIIYIFQPRQDDLWYLVSYMYKDKDGFIIVYAWDSENKAYKRLSSNA